MKNETNYECSGEDLSSQGDIAHDLIKMTSFEQELDKFGKKTLSLFIVFVLDIRHYKKALHVLGQLEQSVVGEDPE